MVAHAGRRKSLSRPICGSSPKMKSMSAAALQTYASIAKFEHEHIEPTKDVEKYKITDPVKQTYNENDLLYHYHHGGISIKPESIYSHLKRDEKSASLARQTSSKVNFDSHTTILEPIFMSNREPRAKPNPLRYENKPLRNCEMYGTQSAKSILAKSETSDSVRTTRGHKMRSDYIKKKQAESAQFIQGDAWDDHGRTVPDPELDYKAGTLLRVIRTRCIEDRIRLKDLFYPFMDKFNPVDDGNRVEPFDKGYPLPGLDKKLSRGNTSGSLTLEKFLFALEKRRVIPPHIINVPTLFSIFRYMDPNFNGCISLPILRKLVWSRKNAIHEILGGSSSATISTDGDSQRESQSTLSGSSQENIAWENEFLFDVEKKNATPVRSHVPTASATPARSRPTSALSWANHMTRVQKDDRPGGKLHQVVLKHQRSAPLIRPCLGAHSTITAKNCDFPPYLRSSSPCQVIDTEVDDSEMVRALPDEEDSEPEQINTIDCNAIQTDTFGPGESISSRVLYGQFNSRFDRPASGKKTRSSSPYRTAWYQGYHNRSPSATTGTEILCSINTHQHDLRRPSQGTNNYSDRTHSHTGTYSHTRTHSHERCYNGNGIRTPPYASARSLEECVLEEVERLFDRSSPEMDKSIEKKMRSQYKKHPVDPLPLESIKPKYGKWIDPESCSHHHNANITIKPSQHARPWSGYSRKAPSASSQRLLEERPESAATSHMPRGSDVRPRSAQSTRSGLHRPVSASSGHLGQDLRPRSAHSTRSGRHAGRPASASTCAGTVSSTSVHGPYTQNEDAMPYGTDWLTAQILSEPEIGYCVKKPKKHVQLPSPHSEDGNMERQIRKKSKDKNLYEEDRPILKRCDNTSQLPEYRDPTITTTQLLKKEFSRISTEYLEVSSGKES